MTCCVSRSNEKAGKLRGREYFSMTEPLLELESASQVAGEAPITTVTFFNGSSLHTAELLLKEQIKKVVKVNPWVAGKVIRTKDHKNLQLAFPPDSLPLPDDMIAELFRVNPQDCKLHSKTPYDDLVTTILESSANLPKLDQPTFTSEFAADDLVTRITLVSDANDSSAFALVVSMSHVIADGCTYYQILNMLSTKGKITPLIAKRNMDATAKIIEAQGEEEYNFMFGSGLVFNAVGGLAFGKSAKLYCHYVDEAKLAAAKAAVKEQCKEQGVKYVSSNDILVSAMANVTKVRLWMMAMNFRGRVKEIDPKLAGNYESCCWMDEEIYSKPAAIRKFLEGGSPMISHTQPLPGTLEMATSAQLGNCSNWASFSKDDLVIGRATQQMHLPLIPLGMIPFESVCLFRPKGGKLALMIMSKRYEREAFLEGMPLGEDVFDESNCFRT